MAGIARRISTTTTPVLTGLRNFLKLWFAKTLFAIVVWVEVHLAKRPKEQQPTLIKTYPVRSDLPCHVFIPNNYKAGDAKLPLYITIHGGAFIGGHPISLHADATYIANTFSVCVVIITYHLAPRHRFPTQSQDCAALTRAIIADESLPIDRTRVVLSGESAGGVLCLSAAQLDGLHSDISAVVSYCPGTNFDTFHSEKAARATSKPGTVDRLAAFLPIIDYAYIPRGVDRRDPLLSPHFAARSKLPAALYLTGFEYDVLCPEAQDTANLYGEQEKGDKIFDQDGEAWSKGLVRWRKVLGEVHGFNAYVTRAKDPSERRRLLAKRNAMYADVFRWLGTKVWKQRMQYT